MYSERSKQNENSIRGGMLDCSPERLFWLNEVFSVFIVGESLWSCRRNAQNSSKFKWSSRSVWNVSNSYANWRCVGFIPNAIIIRELLARNRARSILLIRPCFCTSISLKIRCRSSNSSNWIWFFIVFSSIFTVDFLCFAFNC